MKKYFEIEVRQNGELNKAFIAAKTAKAAVEELIGGEYPFERAIGKKLPEVIAWKEERTIKFFDYSIAFAGVGEKNDWIIRASEINAA